MKSGTFGGLVMPGLVPGIHVFTPLEQDVDGRDKPGHDGTGERLSGRL
jgi:hypothetical protein